MEILQKLPVRNVFIVVLIFLLGTTARLSWTMLPAGPWSMFRQNEQHTGLSMSLGPQSAPTVLWSFTTGGNIYSSPTVAPDGSIYFGSTNGFVYALNPSGTLKWSYDTGVPDAAVWSSPALDTNGSLLIGVVGSGSFNNKLLSLNAATGAFNWEVMTADPVFSSPVIDAGSNIYVGTGLIGGGTGEVMRVSPSGSVDWSVTLPGPMVASPALNANGDVVVSYGNFGLGTLILDVLDAATGATSGSSFTVGSTAGLFAASPMVDLAGGDLAYIGNDYQIHAIFDVSGAASGPSSVILPGTGGPDTTTPAVGPGGDIIIGQNGGELTSYPPGLAPGPNWSVTPSGGIGFGSPAIGADGKIYLPTTLGIEAFDSTGTPLWVASIGQATISSPAIHDGVLYVGTDSGALVALSDNPPIFNAHFDTDTLNQPPSTSPPGVPAADSVVLNNPSAPSGDFIQVQSSLADFTTPAVLLHREAGLGNSPSYQAFADMSFGAGTTGTYTMSWEMAALQAGSIYGGAGLDVPSGEIAFGLNYRPDGTLLIQEGTGTLPVVGRYTPGVSQLFEAVVDMDAGTFDFMIDGVQALDNSPFEGTAVANTVFRLTLGIGGIDTEDYAFDNVRMVIGIHDTDSDGDGTPNSLDTDDDNDGTPDVSDAFPTDPTEWVDTDGDGVGNNADTDDDNDGVPDGSDAFPLDPTEWVDTDGDGIGDNADTDDDGDSINDTVDNCPVNWNPLQGDIDNNGTGDVCDSTDVLLTFFPAEIVCNTSLTPPPCPPTEVEILGPGSFYSVDAGGNGTFDVLAGEFSPISPGPDGGLIASPVTTQPATGSHSGAPDGSESPGIDTPTTFFSNTLMHLTTVPAAFLEPGTGYQAIDTSGMAATWNGIPNIPLGGSASFTPDPFAIDPGTGYLMPSDTGYAALQCDNMPCQDGDHFTLSGSAHVPDGDPSGFQNVFWWLYLEGTVHALTDSDGDNIPDYSDNCPATVNYSQTDADSDGTGDACDEDTALYVTFDSRPLGPPYTEGPGGLYTATGPANDSWTPAYNPGIGQVVEIVNDGLGGPDQYLRLYDGNSADGIITSMHAYPDPAVGSLESGTVIVQWRWSIESALSPTGQGAGMVEIETPEGVILGFRANPDGSIVWDDGISQDNPTGLSASPGVFQTVTVTADMDARTFDMEIDGNPITAGRPFANAYVSPSFDIFAFSRDEAALFADMTIVADIDFDNDGIPDNVDPDDDNDGVADVVDNCPLVANADQTDTDGDGIGDVCDLVGPVITVADITLPATQLNGTPVTDVDVARWLASATAVDTEDGPVPVSNDLSLTVLPVGATAVYFTATDSDGNSANSTATITIVLSSTSGATDSNNNPIPDSENDQDSDGVVDLLDNCPDEPNANQSDVAGGIAGDACEDTDQDGVVDADDPCPSEEINDADGDGWCAGDGFFNLTGGPTLQGDVDNCPSVTNASQADADEDGLGDACDNTGAEKPACTKHCDSTTTSPATTDADGDGLSDDEESALGTDPGIADTDTDGNDDGADNCPLIQNADQLDTDSDGKGDACDSDDDNDTVADTVDNCQLISNVDQNNTDATLTETGVIPDADGDVCDDDIDGDGLINTEETAKGTDLFDPDTDDDGILDSADATPLGEVYRISFELIDASGAVVTPTWRSTGGASVTDGGPGVRVVATLTDPNGAQVPISSATVELGTSRHAGVAVNDVEVCSAGICTDDFSLAPTPGTVTTDASINDSAAEVMLYPFDYGGQATLTLYTTAPDGTPVTGSRTFPLDTDGDLLPDSFELAHGFDPNNAFSIGTDVDDGEQDVDTSSYNTNDGDGLTNFEEMRGIVMNADCEASTAGRTWSETDPYSKDLFVRGVNFSNNCPSSPDRPDPVAYPNVQAFDLNWPGGNAYLNVGITVHDVTRKLNFQGDTEPPGIDIVVVTNDITDSETISSLGNGFINDCGVQCYAWETKGESYYGNQTDYQFYQNPSTGTVSRGTFTYHRNLMHYVFNRPYRMDQGNSPLNPGYEAVLDPYDLIEDFIIENGTGPDRSKGRSEDRNNNGLLDGDLYQSDWKTRPYTTNGAEDYKAGYDYSVFDRDGDGLVELPAPADPASLDPLAQDLNESTLQVLQTHTTLHEIGHAIGMYHTAVEGDLMRDVSLNWNRGGTLSELAASQILIHNKTE